jgi:lipoprotein-anchoring transpeptidase ErfK/SrfK
MEDGQEGSSRARRTGRRHRIRFAVAGALALAVAGIGASVVLSGGGGTPEARARAVTPATLPVTTTLAPTPTSTVPPPASVATTKVANLEVFDVPGGAKPMISLSAKTEYLAPRTLLVVETRGDWLHTLLPIRPNGTTGWVRASDVTIAPNPYRITVSLAEHKVTLYKDGQEVISSMAVIGSPRTPTPLGTFYITDPVDLRSSPNSAYGAFALGLSGFSEVLFEFNGGPGQIALHGTNQPQLVGQDVSNGCIRVPNDVIVEIAAKAPLGTPVVIT